MLQTQVQEASQFAWEPMRIFAVLATVATARSLLDLYLIQRFTIRWRVWVTRRVVDDWLGGYAYYRAQLSSTPIDNPGVFSSIQQSILPRGGGCWDCDSGSFPMTAQTGLMVIADDLAYPDLYSSLQEAETALQRAVHLNLSTEADWRRKVASGNPFVTKVLAQPKISLIGSADALS